MRSMFVRALLVLVVLSAATVQAASIQVNNAAGCSDTTGSPYCTINKAILAAANGDTIQIASGTYAGTIANFSKPLTFIGSGSGTSGTVITKPMTYTGTGPLSLSNLRIQGGGTNFKIGGTGNFSGLTLTDAAFIGNGSGAHGVFIKQNGSVSNVSVTNCTFANHGQSGFLIQKGTGTVTDVENVTVSGSAFDGNGEYGLRSDPRTTNLHVANSGITNNAIDGLLLLNADGVALEDLTITGNRNGILLIPLTSSEAISDVSLTNVNVSNNTRFISGQYGSGLSLAGGTGSISRITATNSTFSSNTLHGVAASGAVSEVSIGCSIIAQNGQHGVLNAASPSAELKAEHVYWGCPGGPGTAGCSTSSGSVDVLPYRSTPTASCTAPVLTSIAVTPAPMTLAHHATSQLTATATYSDGSTADVTPSAAWTSSAPAIASVVAGSVTGQTPGTATITATIGAVSANASVTVTPVATGLTVAPPALALVSGQTGSLAATITWSDGSTSDVTASATWSSSSGSVAGVSSGTVTAVAAGTTTITAAALGVSGTSAVTVTAPTLTAIVVDPATVSIVMNAMRQLTATATYSDGSTADVTAAAVWTSSNEEIASVEGGLAFGNAPGETTITATFEGQTAGVHATVTASGIASSLAITPASATVGQGSGTSLTATLTYADGSSRDVGTLAAWVSADPSIATVSEGWVQGLTLGTATITATFEGVSGSASVTVTLAVTGFGIEPGSLILIPQATGQFTARASYSDGTTTDVTALAEWASSAPEVATVAQGLVTAVAAGSATISATFGGNGTSAYVTVTPVPASLVIEPTALTLTEGQSESLIATVHYVDGTSRNVSATAVWSTSASGVASITGGTVLALGPGTAVITATDSGLAASVTVSVPVTLLSLSVTPGHDELLPGSTRSLRAFKHFNDGTSADVSVSVTWTSSDPAVASVDANGLVTGHAPGQARIKATPGDIGWSVLAGIIVRPSLASISVTPQPAYLTAGAARPFTVRGSYVDGGSGDVTARASWTSSNPSVATVGSTGRVTALAGGSATITASVDGLSTSVALTVEAAITNPPDPATIAPPIDRTKVTTVHETTRFLYEGAVRVQTGVAPGTIKVESAAVLRGRVLDRGGAPLGAVKITILESPELGQTFSRADGRYDLAVNGGAPLTLRFERAGYMPLQRQVPVSWNSYAVAPDVALTAYDSNVTAIATGAATYQVARGSLVFDERGARRETLLFKPGTLATMVLPDGSTQTLSSLSVRATEYTVGADGLAAMPAGLPPESGYTYCVELSSDEAIAAGATSVRFDRPVITYLEEFVGIPVGANIPNGYYDRERGVWVPAPDGRVVMIMSVVEGRAYLDVTGDGAIDEPSVLEALGITTAEREELGDLYGPGQKLWRVPVDHFTPWDHNLALIPLAPWDAPSDPTSGGGPASGWTPAKECQTECGSIIEVEDQTLGERVGIPGTAFSLNYASRRMPGFVPGQRVVLPLTGTSAPRGAKRVEATMSIAGQTYKHVTTNAPNQKTEFEWDGRDSYGRPVQGAMLAGVTLSYIYDGFYVIPGLGLSSFADFSKFSRDRGLPAPTLESFEVRRSVSWQLPLGHWQSDGTGLGAWTLDVHHTYDPVQRMLHKGDGTQRAAAAIGPVVQTVAGSGECCASAGDGGPAAKASLSFPSGLAVGADGTLYIAEQGRVRQVDRAGIITTVAGGGSNGPFEDERDGLVDGPATEVGITPGDLAIGRDGALYMSEGARVRRVAGGSVTTVAGSGRVGNSGDDGDARQASFNAKGIAAAPDGTLLVVTNVASADTRLRRINTAGQVTTIAGANPSDDGNSTPPAGRAVDAHLRRLTSVASGRSGNIYLSGPQQTSRRITPEGAIDNFGPSDGSFSTDFGGEVRPLAVDHLERVHSGTEYTDTRNEPTRFVGGGSDTRDGALALDSVVGAIRDVAIGPDGSRYVIGYFDNRVLRVGPSLPGLGVSDYVVPSADASEEYVFNGEGRHLQTRDAVTGVVRYQFEYDSENRLIRIIDTDGETTTIERDGNGQPAAIVAPGGQRSVLTLDADGHLTSIANPAGEAMSFTYWPGGLLRTFTDPLLNSSTFSYDSTGRLVRDADAAGGQVVLSRSGGDTDYSVITTSGENRMRSYTFTSQSDGTVHRTSTDGSGLSVLSSRTAGGVTSSTFPGGMQTSTAEKPDPRFGMQAPLGTGSITTPGGLTMTTESSRTETRSNPNDPSSPLQSVQWLLKRNQRSFTSTFDVPSHTLTATSPMGRTSQTTFDTQDRPVSSVVPGLQPVGLAYDGRGRLIEVAQGSRMTTFGYDSRNRVSTVTDPLGRAVTFGYDDADRVTRQTFVATGRIIDFSYDHAGNLTAVTPPSRPQHLFAFTTVNLTERYTPPPVANGGATFYEYNRDRQLTLVTRPDSKTIGFGYDGAGRLSAMTIGRGVFTLDYSASTGALQSMQTPEGQAIAFSYDGSVLTTAEWTGVVTGTISWQYDNSFRVASQTVACATATTTACQPIAYSFDDDDLLLSAGALNLQRRAENGLLTGSTIGNVVDAWTYNSFAEPLSYGATYAGAPLFSQQYTRDDVGRITQRVETIGETSPTTVSYTYDEPGRLHEVTTNGVLTARYTYDENGNRLTKTGPGGPEAATVDDQDRLLTYNEAAFGYTPNGELQSKTDPVGSTTFDYDEIGNLLKVVLPDGRTIEYLTDAQNRRIGRKIDGVLVQRWIYSGSLSPAAELDAQGNVVARFIYATRANVPDVIIKGSITYRVITDHLGSPRLILDASTGAIAQQIEYAEFGDVLLDSNPGFQPFGFAGGLYDRDTGLTRFGARDYDPHTGRWLSKDPLFFGGGGTNFYEYAASDPINWTDATGLAYGDLSDIRSTVASYDQYAATHGAGTLRGMAKVASFMLKNFGMLAAQQSGEAFGSGNYECGALRGTQSLSQGLSLALAPSGLKNIGPWMKNPIAYEAGARTVTGATFGAVADLPVAQRAPVLIKEMGLMRYLFDPRGSWGTTLMEGPTPGGWLGLIGLGKGLGAVGGGCGCD